MGAKRKGSSRKPVKSSRRSPKKRRTLSRKQQALFDHLMSGGSKDDFGETDEG